MSSNPSNRSSILSDDTSLDDESTMFDCPDWYSKIPNPVIKLSNKKSKNKNTRETRNQHLKPSTNSASAGNDTNANTTNDTSNSNTSSNSTSNDNTTDTNASDAILPSMGNNSPIKYSDQCYNITEPTPEDELFALENNLRIPQRTAELNKEKGSNMSTAQKSDMNPSVLAQEYAKSRFEHSTPEQQNKVKIVNTLNNDITREARRERKPSNEYNLQFTGETRYSLPITKQVYTGENWNSNSNWQSSNANESKSSISSSQPYKPQTVPFITGGGHTVSLNAMSGLNDLYDGEVKTVQGSRGDHYTLSRQGGIYRCTCKAFIYQKAKLREKSCKHLKELRGEQAENERIQLAAIMRRDAE